MVKEAAPNPLVSRYKDKASGINWLNVGLFLAMLLFIGGGLSWMLLGGFGGDEKMPTAEAPGGKAAKPMAAISYSDLPPPQPQAQVQPVVFTQTARPVEAKAADRQQERREDPRGGRREPKEDKLAMKALGDDIAVLKINQPDPDEQPANVVYGRTDSDPDGTAFMPGYTCQVNAGTALPALLESAVSSGLGGTVRARTVLDVYDASGTCLAIPAGSVLVGEVKQAEVQGQRRVALLFHSITRPWPRNDTIKIEEQGHDGAGRAGIAGRVNSNLLSTGLLVLAATALDIGTFGLAAAADSPWGALGAILAGNANRPLSKAASDRLNLPPVLEIDPLQDDPQLTLVLQEHINADDFNQR